MHGNYGPSIDTGARGGRGGPPVSRPYAPADFGFGRLFAVLRDALVVADAASGTVALWNPAAERLFGYPAAEMVGRSLDALVPERLRAAHRGGLARFAATGRGALINGGLPIRVAAQRRDGAEVEIELSLTPIEDAPVAGRFVCAIIRDITERVRLGEEARAARLAAAERLAEVSRARLDGAALVARTVAHEINNALAPLLGYAELLSLRPEIAQSPDAARYAQLLLEGGEAIAEKVQRLQSMARLAEVSSPLGPDQPLLDLDASAAPEDAPP